jgi:hypothetical protein
LHVLLQAIRDLAGSEVASGFIRPDLVEEAFKGHDRWTTAARKHTLRLHTFGEEDSECLEEF